MRSHAQAPSVGPVLVEIGGKAGILSVVIAAVAAILLALAPAASADHSFDRFIGATEGTDAGLFDLPHGPALDPATGQIYVADRGNARIQRFDSKGNFELAWGNGVNGREGDAEICTSAESRCFSDFGGAEPGMFAGPVSVQVSPVNGHVYVFSNDRVDEFSLDDNGTPADPSDDLPVFERGWGRDVVPPGGFGNVPNNEIRRIAVDATGGSFVLEVGPFVADLTPEISFDATAAEVQTALENTTSSQGGLFWLDIDPGDVAVTGPAGGPWDVEFTGAHADTEIRVHLDADASNLTGGAETVTVTTLEDGANSFETCTVECKRGLTGSGIGHFDIGFATSNSVLAISPVDGDIFVNDERNSRVLRFNADGTLDAEPVIGSPTVFEGSRTPLVVAVDSQGVLYVADRANGGEIERYDTTGAVHSSGSPGFLEPIPAPPLVAATSSSGTRALAVDLDSDGAGPDVDRLFLLREADSGNTQIQQIDSPAAVENPGVDNAWPAARVAEDGNHAAAFLGETISIRGLAYDPVGDRLLFAASSRGGPPSIIDFGSLGLHGIYVLDPDGVSPGLSAELFGAENIGPHQADLSATVDPDGGFARYRFEYSKDGSEWTRLPQRAAEGGDQPVFQTASGLDADTSYQVRLTVEKVTSPDTIQTVTPPQRTFKTLAREPEAQTLSVHSYTDTDAWLAGRVNPQGSETAYHFEWGPTTAYGNQAPASPRSLGAGASPQGVIEKIEGLQPNTTYHYRIVAENAQGITLGEDRTFTTRPAFTGFPARAYEQASPVEKKGAEIGHEIPAADAEMSESTGKVRSRGAVAIDGSTVVFGSRTPFADAQWRPGDAGDIPFQARRNPAGDGWTTKSTLPPPVGFEGNILGSAPIRPPFFGGPSDAFVAIAGPLAGFGHGGYIHDNRSSELTQIFADSTHSVSGIVGASADFSHVVFESEENKTGVSSGSGYRVYEWVDGQIRDVALDESGEPFSDASVLGSASFAEAQALRRTAVSDDGRHIFFSTPVSMFGSSGGPTEVYRRSDGATTLHVSASQASTPDPQGPLAKRFAGASDDGDVAFFLSAEQLTDDANTGPDREGRDLYRYEASSDTLLDVSAFDGEPDGAQVRGPLGISEDGETVYFVARGQLIAGKGEPGADNVYRWHDDGSADGETRYVTTLASGGADDRNLGSFAGFPDFHATARVSADGSALLLESIASLTGYPNGGHRQLYLYEAGAHGGAGGLSCISCRPDGAPAQADTTVPRSDVALSESGDAYSRHLSADGSRVFFHTVEPLLSADNNDVADVYVWKHGRLALVTPGNGNFPAAFVGASRSGDDVFFTTRQQLVGQDDDNLVDVYDARVGGGIPEQFPPPPGEPCVGDACKPGVSETADAPAPASRGLIGEGNVVARQSCRSFGRRAARISRRAKKLRRNASKAARVSRRAKQRANGRWVSQRRRAVRMQRKSKRLGKRAKRLSPKAKACRKAQRRAGK